MSNSDGSARAAPTSTKTVDRLADAEEWAAIVEIVLERDTDAFATASWDAVADDFDAAVFVGYQGGDQPSDTWRVGFPTLDSYRDEWLRQAANMQAEAEPDEIARQMRAACEVAEIRINADRAIVQKQFDGETFGQRLLWQTYYFLRRDPDRWRITGFVGYLPYDPVG